MKKKVIQIFALFFIIFGFSLSLFAASPQELTLDDFASYRFLDENRNAIPVTVYRNYISGDAGVVCGPQGTKCIFVTRNATSSDVPMIAIASWLNTLTVSNGQYMTYTFYGNLYFNGDRPSEIRFNWTSSDGSHSELLDLRGLSVYYQASGRQTCYVLPVSFTISFKDFISYPTFVFYGLYNDFVAFNISDAYYQIDVDPNGAQLEANSMIADINSVITGSVNTAPLTSGVNNIVGNVTSMIPETTDIPYVSDALGSLTQLTNIAAAEIGNFFDPFFTADMSVTVAGVTFNPFITFLIISVVITLITFAIKIFTRGDHER